MVRRLKESLEKIPEHRAGRNWIYELGDAGPAAVLCGAGQAQVVCLEPEFITPQDGHEKQDCEQQAIKRWVKRNAGILRRGRSRF